MSTTRMPSPVSISEANRRVGVDFRAYQRLKIGIHGELASVLICRSSPRKTTTPLVARSTR
ncbi:MAG: hypothetical protein WCB53_13805 [Terriglobales bacterium]